MLDILSHLLLFNFVMATTLPSDLKKIISGRAFIINIFNNHTVLINVGCHKYDTPVLQVDLFVNHL